MMMPELQREQEQPPGGIYTVTPLLIALLNSFRVDYRISSCTHPWLETQSWEMRIYVGASGVETNQTA